MLPGPGLLEELGQGRVDSGEPLQTPEQGSEALGAWASYKQEAVGPAAHTVA